MELTPAPSPMKNPARLPSGNLISCVWQAYATASSCREDSLPDRTTSNSPCRSCSYVFSESCLNASLSKKIIYLTVTGFFSALVPQTGVVCFPI